MRVLVACLLLFAAVCAAELPLDNIRLPPGFHINVFTTATPGARSLAVSPQTGTVFVSTKDQPGSVYGVLDSTGNGTADVAVTLLHGLNAPNGIAWHNGSLFVAEIDRITRYDHADAFVRDQQPFGNGTVISTAFPDVTWHGNKYISIGPDSRMYIDLGAPCNDCILEHAFGNLTFGSLNSMALDGTDLVPLGQGIRNTVGHDFHPDTGALYFTNNGIDQLGDNSPDDCLNLLHSTAFYGFPYCHVTGLGSPYDRLPGGDFTYTLDPEFAPEDVTNAAQHLSFCEQQVTEPVQPLGPHVAALGMRFWLGGGFPAEYNRSIFIAEHGSWARSVKIGYRVAQVVLSANGTTAAKHEVFAQGWLANGTVWGRPVDVAQLGDALLVSDDYAGVVYRISYGA